MQADRLAVTVAHLNTLLDEKLGLRKGSLGQRLRRAGRRLPAATRDDLRALAEAETLAGHPRLSQRLDPAGLERAYRDAAAYLQALDPAAARKTALLRLAGVIAGNLLLVAALLVAVLVWRGFL